MIDDFLNRDDIMSNEKYEEILSNHINLYFKDDRLIKLPIAILYRILIKYFNSKACVEKNEEMIDFLYKYINEKGRDAFVLFSTVKWNARTIHYLNKYITNKFELQSALMQNPSYIFEYMECQEAENRCNSSKIEKLTKQINNMKNSYEKRFQALENKLKKQNELLNKNDFQIIEEKVIKEEQQDQFENEEQSQIERMRIEEQNLRKNK